MAMPAKTDGINITIDNQDVVNGGGGGAKGRRYEPEYGGYQESPEQKYLNKLNYLNQVAEQNWCIPGDDLTKVFDVQIPAGETKFKQYGFTFCKEGNEWAVERPLSRWEEREEAARKGVPIAL